MTFRSTIFVALATLLAPTALAGTAEPIINATASDLIWHQTPEGVSFADLEGNRFEEAYMAMVKLPGGLISPPHTKSATMFGVILSGAMVHTAVGSGPDPEKVLGIGSYYKIPKNVPHVSKCVSHEDCVTFLYQDGKFDFIPLVTSGAQ